MMIGFMGVMWIQGGEGDISANRRREGAC